MIKNKRGMEIEMIGWFLLGIAVFVILIFIILYLSGSQNDALSFFERLLKFGRT